MLPRPPLSTLFPYTTLFRSVVSGSPVFKSTVLASTIVALSLRRCLPNADRAVAAAGHDVLPVRRSEEHTSELQSPYDLVCRLLLEKKNRPYWATARWTLTVG